MMRISQKSLNIDTLDGLYTSLDHESITMKRIFDPRYSFSGDDLIIEGDIDLVLSKLSQDLPKIISVRYNLEEYGEVFEPRSALNIQHGDTKIFFGTTMVDYVNLYDRLRINDKKKILALLFRTQLGGQFVSLMPVKIKGVTITNRPNQSIEFILPAQRLETLKLWIERLLSEQVINFDNLVDIYRETDPNMRKKMEETMSWVSVNLPDIVAKSTMIEDIDIVRAYQNTLALM
ncbi:MAG: hypothetical protein KGD64_08525 [Candidatus Heimdallarchaeota archaeon]|nr:hypothetical protein [Candidatus Heimdallarchaeota archaeon]